MLHLACAYKFGAIALPNVGGCIGGTLYKPAKNNWYLELKKPTFNPPSWVFAPAWTSLYSAMGYASYIVWREGGGFQGAKVPLALYGAQLAINWAWTPMFFGLQSTKAGLMNLAFLVPTAVGCTYEFFKVSHVAGGLMVPYVLWLGFASLLNFTIHQLNLKPPETKEKDN